MNSLAIGIGETAGGFLADHAGKGFVFVLATLVSFAPLVLIPRWHRAAAASAAARA